MKGFRGVEKEIVRMVVFKDGHETFSTRNDQYTSSMMSITFLRKDMSKGSDEATFHVSLGLKTNSHDVDNYFYQ